MRINCLEPKIYNKIAAGEVVERPASIVKELVENSVDAGANLITVSISSGGISEIKVEDNGSGIHFDDLERAFLPHATSKIQDEKDLFGIKTLGFRGEALASIASVSEVVLESKQKESDHGGRIEISGGKIVTEPTITGCSNGTKIIVSNLFFNVPARQKFLKKPKTEEGEITALMAKFILANPCVSFKYIIDGKIKYISSGKGMEEALFVVYGKDAVENTLYLEQDYGYIKIYGYIGKPSFSKPNRTYQTIIINNRVITNQIIIAAVQNAYGEMLMKKQFPFFVLYLDLDYTMLDVNVHPNKHEVRFENGKDIYEKVISVVNRKLNAIDFTSSVRNYGAQETLVQKDTTATLPQKEFKLLDSEETVVIETPKKDSSSSNSSYSSSVSSSYSRSTAPNKVDNHSLLSDTTKTNDVKIEYEKSNENLSRSTPTETEERRNIFSSMTIMNSNDDELSAGVSLGSKLLNELQQKIDSSHQEELEINNFNMKIIGVLFKTYIICEYDDNMLLIDQHAGHERLLYDKFIKEVENQKVDVQPLFLPYVLSLNSIEDDYFQTIIGTLSLIGFEIEEFGPYTYRVSSVPYILSNISLENFFNSLLSDTKNLKAITITEILKEKLASMACKAAVKAGDSLSEGEVRKLLDAFKANGTKLLCPHGRPVVVKIEKKELEKWFKRIV